MKKGFVPLAAIVTCGCLAFFVLGFISLVGIGVFALNNSDSFDTATGGDAGVRDNSCTGLLYPNITNEASYAAAIDDFITDSSPLNGLGKYFVSGGKKTGINPALIAAQAKKESSFGTAGIATKGTNNAFGRTATQSQPGIVIGSRKWYYWSSWAASLDSNEDDEPTYIKRTYIDKRGITNLKDYVYTYAPPTENDSNAYMEQLQDWMQQIADNSNGAVTCQ